MNWPQVDTPARFNPYLTHDVQVVEAWKHSDFLCHNYVLNSLIDSLYNVYIGTQIQNKGCRYKEVRVPPSWVDQKILEDKRKEISVEDLVVRLRIEEDNKLAQKDTYAPDSAKANMVEHAGSSSRSSRRLATTFDQPGTNNSGWWIDTGATRHVCADKSMFHSFRAVDNGHKLYMGNSATADIKGEGDVILKMTSEKELKLTNVLYVPEIRKNLVSGWLLNKFGFRLVFESDKFVLSKNQMYVGRGYAMNGMFKLNVMVVKNEINKMNSSAYLIESSNVWHGRLGHIPRKEKEETPYELWMGRKPSYQYLRVWGCLAKNSTAYRFIVHESKNPDIQKNTIMESRNASFFENIFPCLSKETGSSSRLDDKVVLR
ncbi:pol polyprotein [Tanacetum coccineum]